MKRKEGGAKKTTPPNLENQTGLGLFPSPVCIHAPGKAGGTLRGDEVLPCTPSGEAEMEMVTSHQGGGGRDTGKNLLLAFCKVRFGVFSREVAEQVKALFSRDDVEARGWSKVLCGAIISDTKGPLGLLNLQRPPCYSLNNKTQTNYKLTETIRRNDATVYTTGKHTSPNEDKLVLLNPMWAHYLSPHKRTPGQLSCNVGQ